MPIKTGQKYRFRLLRTHTAKQQWHFVVLSNNSQVVLTSENYARKYGALNTARTLIKYMKDGVAVLEERD